MTLVEVLRAPIPKGACEHSAPRWRAPTLMIRDATLVACKPDKNCVLVIFELEPVATVAEKARALEDHALCLLPQWRLHVSLGVVPKEQAALAARELLAAYGGTSLAVYAGRLVSLPPRTAQLSSCRGLIGCRHSYHSVDLLQTARVRFGTSVENFGTN